MNLPEELTPGMVIGKYKIMTHLASGGMAAVYLARSFGAGGFSRIVALKKPHQQILSDKRSLDMFMDEARLAARIHHPNVVSTLDLETVGKGFIMVMEFIEGDGLYGLLAKSAEQQQELPLPIVIRVILDVLHGLHAAHELCDDADELLGLVHRDVSPQNILVGVDGLSRITDFGIAQARARLSFTNAGELKGKFAYMSPEQVGTQGVDRRADVFATAAVLWECLAGRRLFNAATPAHLLAQICFEPLPSIQELRSIPRALEEVLYVGLARNPDERYESALAFAEALESVSAKNISSHKNVGHWVRSLASSHIERLRRAMKGDAPGSQTPLTPPEHSTTPHPTIRRAYPLTPNTRPPQVKAQAASDYLQYFGLCAPPFSEIRQLQSFWSGGPFEEALSSLSADLSKNPRPRCLLGPPGSGRSVVIAALGEHLQGFTHLQITPEFLFGEPLLASISQQAGIPIPEHISHQEMNALFAAQTQRLLISIDEMSVENISEVLVLASSPLVRLILVGEPGLLKQLENTAGGQRLAASLETILLRALTFEEMLQFIQYRVSLVCEGELPILPSASSQFLYMRSAGSPRLIGVYYHNALVVSFIKQERELSVDVLRLAMKSRAFLTKETALEIMERG